jgi:hypothetical protein
VSSREDRLARARAALGAAEQAASRWGGSIDRTALRGAAIPATSTTTTTPVSVEQDSHPRLVLPEALAPLVPQGTLRAGSTLAVQGSGSTSIMLAVAASAMGEDGWCAIAGMADVGLRAAHDVGVDLTRLALAPARSLQQQPQLAQVLTALVDGVGVLVLGPQLELTPALWRSLTDRARSHDTLVLAARPPGRADLHLEVTAQQWQGLSQGSGRLKERRVRVTSRGRGIADRREATVLLPQVRGLSAAVPEAEQHILQLVPRAG